MASLAIEEVTLELLKLSCFYLISESLSRRLAYWEYIWLLRLLLVWKLIILFSTRTFDLHFLTAPFLWLELDHLDLLQISLAYRYVVEMMCLHYPCVVKLLIRLFLRWEEHPSPLGHLSVLLPQDVLLQALKPLLKLQVLGVVEDLYFLDFFHEGLHPKLHFSLWC